MMFSAKKVDQTNMSQIASTSKTQPLSSMSYVLILTLIFFLFSIFTVVYWWQNKRYEVEGDEPHYLVIADGVINYGTFELTKPYEKEFEERNISPTGIFHKHAVIGPNGLYSIHNIGLPLLIAIPYKLGSDISSILPHISDHNIYGIGTVKLFLILISGLVVVGSWILSGFFFNRCKSSRNLSFSNSLWISIYSSIKPNISRVYSRYYPFVHNNTSNLKRNRTI